MLGISHREAEADEGTRRARVRGKSEVRADKGKRERENSRAAICPGEIRRNKDSFEANSLRRELE